MGRKKRVKLQTFASDTSIIRKIGFYFEKVDLVVSFAYMLTFTFSNIKLLVI